MDGEGDVAEGLAVDLLVPVQHLANGLVPLLDLGPVTAQGRGEEGQRYESNLNKEWRIWNLSLDLK